MLLRGKGLTGSLRDRQRIIAWCLYDWANSAFPTVVTTFVFSVYFSQSVAPDPLTGTVLWSRALTVAAILIAVASPILGAIADQSGRRKPWLAVFTLVCVIACAALWFVRPEPGDVGLALTLYAIAAAAFGIGAVFYDAMLPGVSGAHNLGRVSGWGWAIGYVGGIGCLVIVLFGLVQASPPPLGLDPAKAEPVRASAPFVAAWLLVFSLPLLVLVREQRARDVRMWAQVMAGLRSVRLLPSKLRADPTIARFLIASMFYSTGLSTLFFFGGVYAAGTFGMSIPEILVFGITLYLVAGIGAALFAWVDDRLGSKRTVVIALVSLSFLIAALAFSQNKQQFWIVAVILGIFVGPAQAASRSLMARLAPAQSLAEMFGVYALAGKIALFAGPITFGLATGAFDSQRAGIVSIVPFLVVGLLVLWRVDERRARR